MIIKKCFLPVVFCLILSIQPMLAVEVTSSEYAIFNEIVNVPFGEGDNCVHINYDTYASSPEGPQAMTVDEKGTIYLLDSVKNSTFPPEKRNTNLEK